MKRKGFTPLQIWGKKVGGKFVTGFTLIEILIVIIILGILATMATAFFSSDYNKQKTCVENLEKIHQAIEKYRDATGVYPPDAAAEDASTPGPDTLKEALNNATYIPDANVFKCPADTDAGSTDSYSKFYVKRHDYSKMDSFALGCYRHDGEKSAMNLFFQGQTMKQTLAGVNNGALKPGDPPATGLITFTDGSTANVTQGSVILFQSFNLSGGKCYSLIKTAAVPTTVDCNVTTGSKFEVITPSAIAGVGGTTFRVVVGAGAVAGTTKTTISVSSGVVTATDRQGKRKIEVKENESTEIEGNEPSEIQSSSESRSVGNSGGRGKSQGQGQSD